jgi:hypothetical protein
MYVSVCMYLTVYAVCVCVRVHALFLSVCGKVGRCIFEF